MATQDKYDRQIRLWGANGQRALMNAKILLLGSDPSGCEALKNLVLPAVGHITVVDNQKVTERDLGNNFYVEESDLNNSRAEAVTRNLLEMNPDVKGDHKDICPIEASKDSNLLSHYTLIIANEFADKDLIPLSILCQKLEKKLIIIQSHGLIAYLRVFGGHHEIIETKPQGKFYDLRIDRPFPALQQYVDSFDLDKLSYDPKDYEQFPWLVILIKAYQHCAKENKLTQKDINETIKQWKTNHHLTDEQKKQYSGDNFDEALENSFRFSKKSNSIPSNLEILFSNELCTKAKKGSHVFWILVRALQIFRYNNDGLLPLTQQLPDMYSSSVNYINLQKCFQVQYELDKAQFIQIADEVAEEKGHFNSEQRQALIKTFLDNILYMTFRDYRPFHLELENPLEFDYSETDCQQWYVVLRATNLFYEQNNRWPKPGDEKQLEEITENLRQKKYQTINQIPQSIIKEFCRYEACKIHNIASIIGGLAAQEAVKLLTHQFVSLNSSILFNGIKSQAEVFDL